MVDAFMGSARRGPHGEVRTFPNADHLMSEVADEIAEITGEWVRARFDEHPGR